MSHLASFERFKMQCGELVEGFASHPAMVKIGKGQVGREHYLKYLTTIFHQTFYVPPTMGLAASLLPSRHIAIRTYLTKHATEEHEHWKWVIEDLDRLGYKGPDLLDTLPTFACTQFISFAYFLAVKMPVARLGLPAILEGLSAQYAGAAANKLSEVLNLKKDQMVFATAHGELDAGHTEEIFEILRESPLSDEEWQWMGFAATTTQRLYGGMLQEAFNEPG